MQKLVNGHLYVFDLTPFEITENTDASVIFVQNECLDGYKELNVSLAAKMKGFNQFLLCVQKQEWSMPADPVDGGLEWSASTATVRIGDTNSYPTLINPNELEVTYSSSNESVATIDSTGAITLVGTGSTNITVESAAEPGFTADSASYTLTVLAALYTLTVNYNSAFSSAVSEIDPGPLGQICGTGDETHQPSLTGVTDWIQASSTIYDEQNLYVAEVVYSNIPEGWQFQFDERSFPAGFNLTSSPVLETGTESLWGVGQTYVMPASDVTVTLTAQDDVDPAETEYLSPRIANVNNDVNNFNIGAILNVKDNTALVNAIEFTGHAEQGSTSSLEAGSQYMLGTPFSMKFDENDPKEYFSLCYNTTNSGHKFAIYLSDAANENYASDYYTIDSYDLNSLEDDHTYRIGLGIDISDAQTNGIVHVLPTFAIDSMTCSPRDDQDNVLESPQSLDFDISQGTQALEDWISNFQSKLYLFNCDYREWGEFIVAGVPFELSTVKVEYSTGSDLSQLQVGTEASPWILTATSPNTFNDGIDDWSLSPMRDLVPNVPHIFKLTGNNIHDHVSVYLDGHEQTASAAEFVEGLLVAEGTNILIRALESSEQYTLQSGSINWSNDEQAWYTNMPNEDLEICIDYNGDPR